MDTVYEHAVKLASKYARQSGRLEVRLENAIEALQKIQEIAQTAKWPRFQHLNDIEQIARVALRQACSVPSPGDDQQSGESEGNSYRAELKTTAEAPVRPPQQHEVSGAADPAVQSLASPQVSYSGSQGIRETRLLTDDELLKIADKLQSLEED